MTAKGQKLVKTEFGRTVEGIDDEYHDASFVEDFRQRQHFRDWDRRTLEDPVNDNVNIDDVADTLGYEVDFIGLVCNNEMKVRVANVLNTLKPREEAVIRYRYGINLSRVHTLADIAEKFGVSRSYIGQLEIKAMNKLRHPAKKSKLKDFLD